MFSTSVTIAMFSAYYMLFGLAIGCALDKHIIPKIEELIDPYIKDAKIKNIVLLFIQVALTAILAEFARNASKVLPGNRGIAASGGGVSLGLASYSMQDSLKRRIAELGLCK
jgi:hypothetical protein